MHSLANIKALKAWLVNRHATETKETDVASKHNKVKNLAGGRPVDYLQSMTKDLNLGLPRNKSPSDRVESLNPGSPDYNTNVLNPSAKQPPLLIININMHINNGWSRIEWAQKL